MSNNIGKPSSEAIQRVLRWLLDPSRTRRRLEVNPGALKTIEPVAQVTEHA